MKRLLLALCAVFGVAAAVHGVASDDVRAAPASAWSVWGGEVGVRWNRDLAHAIGLRIAPATARLADAPDHAFERFEVRRSGALEFRMDGHVFRGFAGGSLQARGGYVLEFDRGRIDLTDFRLVPRKDDPYLLDLVSADGKAWFYADRLMYEQTGADGILAVRTLDLRMTAALAERLGQPMVANWTIADMELESEVLVRGASPDAPSSCNVNTGAGCNFAGSAAPGGGTYQADLFMKSFSLQFKRCSGCSGPSGSGTVVFAPSSTLKNNVNAGSIQTTIAGQGALGSSSALWAADIPWYSKFSGLFAPYGNDQHPYLIWNMYRLNADGSIEQIGRSGVKHAFLTTNVGCADGRPQGHVIGAACEDTYSDSNNDSTTALGPRSEIIPATNQWGRCGSIYDANCDGANDNPSYGSYEHRLTVGESQISLGANPGATFLFESWYLAREDINIYNSMGTVATTQNWNGSVWGISASTYKLDSAIDRWVSPTAPPPNAKNSELAVGEGHARLAVKVTDNGDGTWRYDYAVMNFDFARATTQGAEPNLRVLSNKGFDRFSVPIATGAVVSATRFRDGDLVAANDWTVDTSGGRATWTAPAAGPTLDWGTLYAFSLTVNAPPVALDGSLRVAQSGSPASYDLATLAPGTAAPAPTATVAPTDLAFDLVQGASDTQSFTLGNTGAAGSTLHFTVDTAPSSCASPAAVAWLAASPVSGSIAQAAPAQAIGATANAASLAPGSYAAKVCVRSDDPAHAVIEVAVALAVSAPPPSASVAPTSVSLDLVQGASGSTSFALGNSGAVGSVLHYTIDTAPSSCASPGAVAWLGASPASGSVAQGAPSQSIAVNADAAGLVPGGYSAKLCVHSDDPVNAVIEVSVALSVAAPQPTATVAPGTLALTLVQGTSGSLAFTIGNTGQAGSVLHFTLDTAPTSCGTPAAVAWLSLAPASGAVAQGASAASIEAAFDAGGLAPGTYTASACVHTDDPAHATVAIGVTLDVTAPVPTAAVAPTSLEFHLAQGAAANSDLALSNTGDGGSVLHYTIDEAPTSCASAGAVSWLSATPASGSVDAAGVPATVTVHADATALDAGAYTATICVRSDDPAHATIEVAISLVVSDVIFANGFDASP
ncbi:BACON domain-containing protein [Dokdonella sp.]|uniref:COG1470 family protein n=1 Tax=Dokdonella sp. TaxID=2291710 RepID=UPI002F409078